ncbi:Hypothetical protein PHPALM_17100 [Phytophthora palmivora]|uniref:Uncharacterized protein n=1 Tax=Phytophthora palmivora TaxID=4796 RepID=A0A2P4XN43_9STRA|nr:Hypothetical protein PHPALM_17100 [Phytophthora palmivora]
MWHANFVAEMTSASANTGTLVGFIDDTTHKIYSWIDMLLSCNLPFSFCESEAASNYVKIDSLSTDSLVKYMRLLVPCLNHLESFLTGGRFGLSTTLLFESIRQDDKTQIILIAMHQLSTMR